MNNTIFEIPEHNLTALEERLIKLNRKAVKLGTTPISYRILGTLTKEKSIQGIYDKIKLIETYYEVELLGGEAPKLKDWEFLAKVDLEYSNPIISAIPNVQIPEHFYTRQGCTCDHCNSNRQRKIAYVVRNTVTNEYKQVGKSCLKDFLGHTSPTATLSWFQYLISYDDMMYDLSSHGSLEQRYHIRDVLAIASIMVEEFGYWSVSRAKNNNETVLDPIDYIQPTSGLVKCWLNDAKFRGGFRNLSDADYEYADLVIDNAKDMVKTPKNDYFRNLDVLLNDEIVKFKEFSLIVSTIGLYEKHLAKDVEKKNQISEWFGEVGKRLENSITIISKTPFENDFGISYVVNMIDDAGRYLTWFTSNPSMFDIGNHYKVKLTVKKHGKYQDWKQTVVNRVSEVTG